MFVVYKLSACGDVMVLNRFWCIVVCGLYFFVYILLYIGVFFCSLFLDFGVLNKEGLLGRRERVVFFLVVEIVLEV